MADKFKKVLILVSGGIDSTACIHYYKSRGFLVETIFIEYAQLSIKKEREAIKRISSHYKVKTDYVRIKSNRDFKGGEIIFRNIFLISAALISQNKFRGIVSLGIHSGTEYVDCSPSFVKATNSILDLYSNGTVKLETPFLNFTKSEIVEYCILNEIPIHLTYSCELGLNQPCGKCLSCKGLKRIYDSKNLNTKTPSRT